MKMPLQLKQVEGARAIKIDMSLPDGHSCQYKKPLEVGWQKTNNYSLDNPAIIRWVEKENNYGIATGYGDIIVLDIEAGHNELMNLIENNLPKTFTVKTGSDGRHYYFKCPNITKKILLEKDGIHYGEIQAQGQQVVGPGCKHKSGNRYEIINNTGVAEIKKEDLSIIKNFFREKPDKPEPVIKSYQKDEYGLSITDVVPLTNLRKKADGEYQGPHPMHSKKGEDDDFTVNPSKNLWHCFWHNTGGGPLEWIAVAEGIIHCADARPGWRQRK